MLHATLRWSALIGLAILFIFQQVFEPLVTVWVALGEFFHCASFVILVDLLITNRGFKGLSCKTQILFLLVYWFRYFDSFFTQHPNHWIKALKVFYMLSSLFLVLSLFCLRATWERRKDSCSLFVLFALSLLFGSVNFFLDPLTPATTLERSLQFFWVVSHYLQGFAMLPQFIFCYRDEGNKDKLLTSYVLLLGSYRFFYALNWVERKYNNNFFYISGPMGLLILTIFLADFLQFKIKNKSCISSLVLKIDDRMQVSRLPLLSGLNEEYERVDAADAAAAAGPTIISVSRGAAPDSSSSSNNNSSSSSSRAMQVVGRSQGVALYEQPTEPYVAPSLPPLLEQAAAAAAAANAANAANGALQQQTEGPTRACTVPSSPVATTAGAAGEVELKTVIV